MFGLLQIFSLASNINVILLKRFVSILWFSCAVIVAVFTRNNSNGHLSQWIFNTSEYFKSVFAVIKLRLIVAKIMLCTSGYRILPLDIRYLYWLVKQTVLHVDTFVSPLVNVVPPSTAIVTSVVAGHLRSRNSPTKCWRRDVQGGKDGVCFFLFFSTDSCLCPWWWRRWHRQDQLQLVVVVCPRSFVLDYHG